MRVENRWKCAACETDYERHYDAEDCCSAIPAFRCGVCKLVHEDREDATECCVEVAGDDVQCLYCPTTLTPDDIHDSNIVGSLMLCSEHRPPLNLEAAAA